MWARMDYFLPYFLSLLFSFLNQTVKNAIFYLIFTPTKHTLTHLILLRQWQQQEPFPLLMNSASHLTSSKVTLKLWSKLSKLRMILFLPLVISSWAKSTIDANDNISYSHVRRLGNSVTHNLTKHARHLKVFSIWMEDVPPHLFSILFADHSWFSFMKFKVLFLKKKKKNNLR